MRSLHKMHGASDFYHELSENALSRGCQACDSPTTCLQDDQGSSDVGEPQSSNSTKLESRPNLAASATHSPDLPYVFNKVIK